MTKQKQKNNFCTQHVLNLYFSKNSMNNLLSYCGLVEARISASEKDLPVPYQRGYIYAKKYSYDPTVSLFKWPYCHECARIYELCAVTSGYSVRVLCFFILLLLLLLKIDQSPSLTYFSRGRRSV